MPPLLRSAAMGYLLSNRFLVRMHEITTGEAAIWINAPVSMSSAIGTFATGWLATKLYKNIRVPSPGCRHGSGLVDSLLCLRLYDTESTVRCPGSDHWWVCKYGYIAAQYTIGQGVVSMRVRATATAVLLFIANLIGYGCGPLFIGFTSDIFFANGLAELGVAAEELARNQCHPRVVGELSENLQNVCGAVYAQSLQSAMIIMAMLYASSALFSC
ncbi:MAG: hypothetical protein CM15mP120_08880 [Pseudomonadota bacterium]|nr:MAG: hypothetical protein CM15mP120_08880 [Pseudomonadota bacterium]